MSGTAHHGASGRRCRGGIRSGARGRWTAARALAPSSFAGALNPADDSHPADANQYDLNDQQHSYL